MCEVIHSVLGKVKKVILKLFYNTKNMALSKILIQLFDLGNSAPQNPF